MDRHLILCGLLFPLVACTAQEVESADTAPAMPEPIVSAEIPAPRTAFGFTFGGPLEIPECPKERVGRTLHYNILPGYTCFYRAHTHGTESSALGSEYVSIRFPLSESPQIVLGELQAQMIDGVIEGLAFSTMGIRVQEEVLDELRQKYGEPETLVPRRVQSRMGATYEVINASWRVGDIRVMYRSVDTDMDHGYVSIRTVKGQEEFNRGWEEYRKQQRPL
jgi:hypothetical protein